MKRVILDEGVPRVLARKLRENGVDAVAFPNGWKQLSNGALLDEIEQQGFQVLITSDKRMQFQQNMTSRSLSVLVLPTNQRVEVLKLVSEVVDALQRVAVGDFLYVTSSGAAPAKLPKHKA